MKLINITILLTGLLAVLPLLTNAQVTPPMQQAEQARSLVNAFGRDLKSVLTTTMKTKGPIKALEVCHTEAGPIAQSHSALSNWHIARTSLKVRNASNTPDEWESAVLAQFEQRKAAGENVKTMEYSETVQVGDKTVYRYMKPIPTAGGCLACHGEVLSQQIATKVKSLYPHDQATGFTIGDIRGAFSLQKISE